ncbi:MAG: prephenate dehydrogenase/arogenate dehydrogenase family protein [Patescibacteria group bacterium]
MKKNDRQTIGIIGLGLIGTSIGMALKKSDTAIRITGFTRSRLNGTHALEKGAVDTLSVTVAELIGATDIIILATPIHAIITLLAHIGACAHLPILVTDTGSTKVEICKAALRLPAHITFIGGHPLAGKEVSGANHAEATLFKNRPWILTPTNTRDRAHLSALRSLLAQTGAHLLEISPKDHDRIMTPISHMPFLISALLMQTTQTHRDWPEAKELAGNGFRDTTRLAGGNPVMHTDILRTNRMEMITELSRIEKQIRSFRQDLAARRWSAIEDRLRTIQKNRLDWGKDRV